MFLAKKIEKYKQKRQLKQIIETVADYTAWQQEPRYLIKDAQECLSFIDSLPQDEDVKFLKKWLKEIIAELS